MRLAVNIRPMQSHYIGWIYLYGVGGVFVGGTFGFWQPTHAEGKGELQTAHHFRPICLDRFSAIIFGTRPSSFGVI